jgi:hypothetical protein
MKSRRVVLLSSALLLAPGALPATAGEYWQLYRHHDRHWHTVHRSIYELENRIALLEANPYLRGDHGCERSGAGLELIQVDPNGLPLRADSLPLHGQLLRQDANRSELVLDSLESRKHGLPISGDALPINRARGVDLRPAQSAVKQDLRGRAAQ